jgi:hypothetical protein
MNQKLILVLKEARDEANSLIVDELPRSESEPYITIWENINNCLRMLNKYERGK